VDAPLADVPRRREHELTVSHAQGSVERLLSHHDPGRGVDDVAVLDPDRGLRVAAREHQATGATVGREDLQQVEERHLRQIAPQLALLHRGVGGAQEVVDARSHFAGVEGLDHRLGPGVQSREASRIAASHHEEVSAAGARILADHVEEGAQIEHGERLVHQHHVGAHLGRARQTRAPIRGQADEMTLVAQRLSERLERGPILVHDQHATGHGALHRGASGCR